MGTSGGHFGAICCGHVNMLFSSTPHPRRSPSVCLLPCSATMSKHTTFRIKGSRGERLSLYLALACACCRVAQRSSATISKLTTFRIESSTSHAAVALIHPQHSTHDRHCPAIGTVVSLAIRRRSESLLVKHASGHGQTAREQQPNNDFRG